MLSSCYQLLSWVIYCIISISPGNLTFADVHTSLGHEAHPSLGLLTAEGVEVVDVRRLLCDLKVSDTAVPLHTQTESTYSQYGIDIITTGYTRICTNF